MFIPLRDDVLTRQPPMVTAGIVGACVVVFLYQLTLGSEGMEVFTLGYGMIPAVLFGTGTLDSSIPTVSPWLTIFTSMFVHGGFLHIIGNMVYLWVFGHGVEEAMGRVRFAAFYLLCGTAAALTQAFIEPESTLPMVGASGAISGVLGAYLVLYPRARVVVLFVYGLVTTLNLPAKALLIWWIVIQLVSILISGKQEGGVAWFAHVGGFFAGMALVWLFRSRPLPPRGPSPWGTTTRTWRRGPWG